MRREYRERFPRYWLQSKPLVSDPGMHHGTCVTHVPWCMSGSLTRGGGKTFPAFPAHAQPAILRIWQEVHITVSLWVVIPIHKHPVPRESMNIQGYACQWPGSWSHHIINGLKNYLVEEAALVSMERETQQLMTCKCRGIILNDKNVLIIIFSTKCADIGLSWAMSVNIRGLMSWGVCWDCSNQSL